VPKIPSGLSNNIIIRIKKTKASLYPDIAGKKVTNKISDIPKIKPPSIAPGILPIPPTTAAINAFKPGIIPIVGTICGNLRLHKIPPTAARAEPIIKVTEIALLTPTPINLEVSISRDIALIAKPVFV